MRRPRVNPKKLADDANKARAFTLADAAAAKRLAPKVGIAVQAAIAQALRDERMGERSRCTRITEAALDICSDASSRAALQFVATMIKPLSSAKQSEPK